MGNNSSVYNIEEEYSKKSLKELIEIKVQFSNAATKHPKIKMFNEHLGFVLKCIAERIGTSNRYKQ